jgi:hypothetical protein
MKSLIVLLVVLLLAGSEAVAQTQAGEPPPQAPHQHPHPGAAKPADLPLIQAPAQIPIGTRVGDVVSGYNYAGRRDPFVSLVYSRRASSGGGSVPIRGNGLPSLSITDVRVAGVLRLGQQFVAILEGPDKQSFNARAKDRLLDAVIKSIDATGVTFVEQSESTGPGREIRKDIRRAAEENR